MENAVRTYLSRADESRIVIYSFVGCFSESFFSFRNCSLISDVLAYEQVRRYLRCIHAES